VHEPVDRLENDDLGNLRNQGEQICRQGQSHWSHCEQRFYDSGRWVCDRWNGKRAAPRKLLRPSPRADWNLHTPPVVLGPGEIFSAAARRPRPPNQRNQVRGLRLPMSVGFLGSP
jgi:hypothetical protein